MRLRQTVFVVDDDEGLREAMKTMFEAHGLHVETFASATAFLQHYAPQRAGCLVLDIRMPGMSGMELQERLRKRRFPLPIIFLTGHGDVPLAVRAMKNGAQDFIQKPLDGQKLVMAVMSALRTDSEQRLLVDDAVGMSGKLPERLANLSSRERQVLQSVLAGKQSREIAIELCLSVKTIEFHRARIREKLGVGSNTDLFRLFLAADVDPTVPAA